METNLPAVSSHGEVSLQTIVADWACPTQISSPSSDPENDILTSVFRLVNIQGLLRCERVCKGWHDVLRQPKSPGVWGTQLGLSGRSGARRPWRILVKEIGPPPWSPVIFRKKADYDKVLAWLHPRIAGFSSLSLELDRGLGLDLVLAGPGCCTQLPPILVDWTCRVEGGKANHMQRISQLTALTSLAIDDSDGIIASVCALQQLHKLRNLRTPRYDALTFAEAPFINLVELDLCGGTNQVCNLEYCVQLTRLALYGVDPDIGLTQLILPKGLSVLLKDLFLANSRHEPEGDYHVENLHLASQLTRLQLECVYPKWDMGWPSFLPDLSDLEVQETSSDIGPAFHSLLEYPVLTSLTWADVDVDLLDGLSKLTQLSSLTLMRLDNANPGVLLSQVKALTQLTYLMLHTLYIPKFALTMDILQFAAWPYLQELEVVDECVVATYTPNEQLRLCELQGRLRAFKIQCNIDINVQLHNVVESCYVEFRSTSASANVAQ